MHLEFCWILVFITFSPLFFYITLQTLLHIATPLFNFQGFFFKKKLKRFCCEIHKKMGSSSSPLELTLSLKPSYVPKSINHLLTDLDQIDSVSRKLSVLKDYLNKHKEELHKVEQFKRELPQCVLLLMDGELANHLFLRFDRSSLIKGSS